MLSNKDEANIKACCFPSSVGEICALAIISPRDGESIGATLDNALALLRSARIETEAASEVRSDGRDLATILLRSNDDRMRAFKLLLDNGVEVKLGPAGF